MGVDYGLLFAGGGSPLDSAVEGYKVGSAIQNQALVQQDAQQKRTLQEQMQRDLGALSSNPKATAADYSSMMVKYPTLSEHFKRGWDVLDKAQQQSKLSSAMQVYSAINAGRSDVAVGMLNDQALARRNSGDEPGAKEQEALAALISGSPESAKSTAGLMLAAVMGPDKFAETFTKLGGEQRAAEKHTPEMEEAIAKAKKASVDSRFAESNAVADLAKKGWDITKIQEDIAYHKENNRIAALNAAIGKEGNEIRREELKLKRDEAVQKRDESVRTRTQELESARSSMDNFLNTADRILATPKNVMHDAMGPYDARTPTFFQSTADFEALMENLDAQSFISQVPSMKGLGALSDAEGKRLSSSLQSFSLKQSPEQLVKNVQEAQRLILKARKSLAAKHGVPETVPDTPAAAQATTPDEIDALLKQYGNPFVPGAR